MSNWRKSKQFVGAEQGTGLNAVQVPNNLVSRNCGDDSWIESSDAPYNVNVSLSNGGGEKPPSRQNDARGEEVVIHRDEVEAYWAESPNIHHKGNHSEKVSVAAPDIRQVVGRNIGDNSWIESSYATANVNAALIDGKCCKYCGENFTGRQKGASGEDLSGDEAIINRQNVDDYWGEGTEGNRAEKATEHRPEILEIRQVLSRNCGDDSWIESSYATDNGNAALSNGAEKPHDPQHKPDEEDIINRAAVEAYWGESSYDHGNGACANYNCSEKPTVHVAKNLGIRQVCSRNCGDNSWIESSDATDNVNAAVSNGGSGAQNGARGNSKPDEEGIINRDVEAYGGERSYDYRNYNRSEEPTVHMQKNLGIRQVLPRNCGDSSCIETNYPTGNSWRQNRVEAVLYGVNSEASLAVKPNGHRNGAFPKDNRYKKVISNEDYWRESHKGGAQGSIRNAASRNANAASSYWSDRRRCGEQDIQSGAHGDIRDPDLAAAQNWTFENGNNELCHHCHGSGRRRDNGAIWGENHCAGNSGARNLPTRDFSCGSNDRNSRGDGQRDVVPNTYETDNYGRKFRQVDDAIQREFYIPPVPTEDENEIFKSEIISGINFAKFDRMPVKRSGANVPHQLRTFREANFQQELLENVWKSGYAVPTPIQKAAMPVILAGRDLMACAQTGSGKTAAYLLPIIESMLRLQICAKIGRPAALVLAPTRELSTQIYHEARKFAYGTFIRTYVIYGGTSFVHQNTAFSQGCHILIATPGRLIDFVEKGVVTFDEMRFLVLDEADRMLDMGFRAAISQIMNHATIRPPGEHQTLMFSATYPKQIQLMAAGYLHDYVFIAVGRIGGANSDVLQLVHEVKKRDKLVALRQLLMEADERTLVFVETKRNVDYLASILYESEHTVACLHGDRLQRQREEALNDFKTGRVKVLIATAVAARGLDIKDVRHVVNYDLPRDINEYVHRIGRTGRLGNYGKATSFFDPYVDVPLVNDLIRVLEDAGQDVPSFLRYYATGEASFEDSGFGAVDVRGQSVMHEATEMWD